MPNRFISYETRAGEPIQAGNVTLIPFAKALIVQLPFRLGGLVWNRPDSVLVQTPDGQEQKHRVVDVTRQAQAMIMGATFVGTLLIWLALRNRKQGCC